MDVAAGPGAAAEPGAVARPAEPGARPATVLVLGGTGEGRELAALLAAVPGLRVVSSLAGRVANPRLPVGEVRVGGFGGVDGLVDHLRAEGVTALVDATHPFAERITANAAAASARTGVPLLVLRRPGWTERPGDDWTWVDSLAEASAAIGDRRALITTGRQGVGAFRRGLARMVDPPDEVAPGLRVLLDRGPYTLESELDLLRDNDIQVLVTKDSGGGMTSAKLDAARVLKIPVVLVRRPPPPPDARTAASPEEAAAWVRARLG